MILVLLVSKAVWCDLLDDFKLWRPFGVKTPKAFFWVRVWSLTGQGNATHCQVQKLMPPGNWFVVVCPSCLFYTLSLCLLFSLILLFWSVSLPPWEKQYMKAKMPWSFTAFSILACLLWHFYCILRKQALVFPFLLKPKHHLLSLVSNIHDVAGLCLPLSCNPCQPLFVNLWRKAKYPDLNKNHLHLHFDTVFGSICVFFLLYIIFYSIFHLFNIFCISSSHLLECFASYLQDLELNRILPRERFEQICPIMDSKWMSGSVFFPVKKVTWEWQVCFKGSTLTFSG